MEAIKARCASTWSAIFLFAAGVSSCRDCSEALSGTRRVKSRTVTMVDDEEVKKESAVPREYMAGDGEALTVGRCGKMMNEGVCGFN